MSSHFFFLFVPFVCMIMMLHSSTFFCMLFCFVLCGLFVRLFVVLFLKKNYHELYVHICNLASLFICLHVRTYLISWHSTL